MKYGERFEKESVPEWSLHNIDYNALKHYIKAHTTKAQAKAIAIPGQRDDNLLRVEDELYLELCRQHDRVDLFVVSKADEISRRLQHLSDQIHRLLLRSKMTLKRQRKLVKYEREVIRCGDEIQALQRFVNAQVVAFRKILKKYKKWTGSTTLGARFKENVLSHPKSFTKRDFDPLQQAYEELLAAVRAVTPVASEPVTPSVDDEEVATPRSSSRREGAGGRLSPRQVVFRPGPPDTRSFYTEQVRYWNEYDYGSEAGDVDDGYAIYIQPEDEHSLPNLAAVLAMVTTPLEKAKAWLAFRHHDERAALLPAPDPGAATAATTTPSYGTVGGDPSPSPPNGGPSAGSYFTNPPGQYAHAPHAAGSSLDTDADDENEEEEEDDDPSLEAGYASSDGFPVGYDARYAALPSINDQRMARYRERVLVLGTLGCMAAAVALLGIAAVLISTGRHKLRAEVDAGVTMGVVASLGCACSALGMTLARRGKVSLAGKVAVWVVFVAVCVSNGMLLVLVMGNTSL
ncbi:Xenotropic and polytropic retrovirus receptor 1 [Pleurostoma richardsiae]|uniref:Xenotropic and polytropic retrovirus receptor 1 n=1 Tax=Pleurostoma richardsiae TaxID=41990 RepID=A0AA38RQA0_9PEZI|nr:Xenotropic and polytropic retrovirus receptor 1 [Pleurostoma richardsiae]